MTITLRWDPEISGLSGPESERAEEHAVSTENTPRRAPRPAQVGRRLMAVSAVVPLVLTGCAGGDPDEDGPGITLTVSTFNEFGYEELFDEYEEQNPGITIRHIKADTSDNALVSLRNSLAAGSGAADIEALEVYWMGEMLQYSEMFADLSDPAVTGGALDEGEIEDRWMDWKLEDATAEDGSLIGYGTDIGPMAVCYRADLFEEAGLPTDRDEVAELLEGDWDTYFEVGEEFVEGSEQAGTDAAWYDSAAVVWQAAVNQISHPYHDEDGTYTAADNPELRELYDTLLEASVDDGLSAGLTQWSADWSQAFQHDSFATTLCPGWMLGVIEGNADGIEGWDVADVFPGGGGNWGGSYLSVPAQGDHVEEAAELAAWLTAPEQQARAFDAVGAFPSQEEALDAPELTTDTDPFFNDAPTGEIFVNRAEAIEDQPYMGPEYMVMNNLLMLDAINRVDVDGIDSPEESWEKFESDAEGLR